MVTKYVAFFVITVGLLLFTEARASDADFLNEWVAKIEGGLDNAHDIVRRYGFEVVRSMPQFEDHYILQHIEVPHRSERSADHHTRRLADENSVKWVEQQFTINREKRSVLPDRSTHSQELLFIDPMLKDQWYIVGNGTNGTYKNRVLETWKLGYSGKGVVVTVVDDGLEKNHTDLIKNYDPNASIDLNDNDTDPFPRYDGKGTNRHGTRCAGEIAMEANNTKCGVGIAYNSKIGGIRFLDGNITDRMEADALSFNNTYIDIYSLSWGPTDDGKTLDGPHTLAAAALKASIDKGRGGKGAIFVLASGNGGGAKDNCNCDGYASSLFTISVSAATQRGYRPWYGELCPSTLTTTHSSGSPLEKSIVTTDLRDKCTDEHTGTSASAPLAAATIALALEANANLTWRDVQHLVVLTSKPDPLAIVDGWCKNAAGFCVNLAFGFGLMDALDLVKEAKTWTHVKDQAICVVKANTKAERDILQRDMSSGEEVEVTITTDACKGTANEVNYLEHVQFVFTMNYTTRGALSASATSPSGTTTLLLDPRNLDNSTDNFSEWPLMSVHWWGERPNGSWTFTVMDKNKKGNNNGKLLDVKLVLHGTKEKPVYQPSCNLDVKQCKENNNRPTPTSRADNMKRLKNLYKQYYLKHLKEQNLH